MNSTHYAVYRFLTEILLAAVIYVVHLNRRPYFLARLAVCLPMCYFISRHWNRALSQVMIFSVLRYILLFLLVVLVIYCCYKVPLRGALFCAISAYATQHFAAKVYYFATTFIAEDIPLPEEVAVYSFILLISYGYFYLLFARRMREQNYTHVKNNEILLLSILIVLCMIVLSVAATLYVEGTSPAADAIIRCYGLVSCILILCFQFGIFQKGELHSEVQQIEQLWDMERRQLQNSKETMDLINIKCHDLKHLLSHLEERVSKEELGELQSKLSVYDTSVKTGNDILDIILAEKSLVCEQKKVKLTCMADGAQLGFMQSGDIYSLFGNAIDNAIEAASAFEDITKRVVSVVVKKSRGLLSVHFENYYQGSLMMERGLPVTQKADKRYHGFGMKSIRLISEKYHGALSCRGEGGAFQLDFLFPIKD